MRRKSEGEGTEVGMELKYCEHCGGLWVRECGAGVIYCDRCQAKVADLPAPRKRKGRLILPVRPHTAVEEYAVEVEEDGEREMDLPDARGPNDLDLDPDVLDRDASDFEAGGAA